MQKYSKTDVSCIEFEAIDLMHEVVPEAENPSMTYLVSKNTAVIRFSEKEAFYSPPPFPPIHVDTIWKFREIYKFRDKAVNDAWMVLILQKKLEANEMGINQFEHGALHCGT